MNKIYILVSLFFVSYATSFSQKSINDYKYIIIPNQFEFLKEADQYQINSLTKFLFNKYGYTAFLNTEELPQDLRFNECLALTADVVKESGFLKTKLRIDLKDCNGTVIESSQVGETREKEYAKAYNIAIRSAFETFRNMDYKYQPNKAILAKAITQPSSNESLKEKEEIDRLKEEIKSLKETKVEVVEVVNPIMEVTEVKEPLKNSTSENKADSTTATKPSTSEVLYAQALDNGFQIVDSTPKVIMILYTTAAKDVFTVKDKNAIVFKKENQWIYSENDGKDTKETVLNIKF